MDTTKISLDSNSKLYHDQEKAINMTVTLGNNFCFHYEDQNLNVLFPEMQQVVDTFKE